MRNLWFQVRQSAAYHPDSRSLRSGRRYSGAGYIRRWIECAHCGAVTNEHQPENLERLRSLATGYYEVDLRGGRIAERYESIMSLPPSQSDNEQRVKRIAAAAKRWFSQFGRADHPGNKLKVLDIGAGMGVFLSRFLRDQENWLGVALESDAGACEHLRSIGQFEVIEGVFEGQTKLTGFDLCTLNKVVEHVEAPIAFVQDAARTLKADCGLLYLEVPDRLTIQYRPCSDNILGALHHHLYDPASVAHLLRAAGLLTLSVERIFEPSGKISVVAFAAPPSAVARLAAPRA